MEVGAENKIKSYVCFIHTTKTYGSVDQTLLWTILVHFDVSQSIISVIRQFRDGMQAYVRLNDRVYTG